MQKSSYAEVSRAVINQRCGHCLAILLGDCALEARGADGLANAVDAEAGMPEIAPSLFTYMAETNSNSAQSTTPSSPETEPRRRWRVWPWSLLPVAAAVVLVLLRRGQPPQAQAGAASQGAAPPAFPVSTATARKGDIGIYVNALGLVTPLNTVAVKSRVDGELVKVYYSEGQKIREGDPLVEIDPTPFEATLSQLEGQLARDQALLENAQLDLSRYQEAFAKNAIPKQQLDTQVATVHQYEGLVKLDTGQLANARVQLGYCHIAAPISGRVGLRLVDAGNIVHATDTSPLVVITEEQPITVVFNVAEDYLPQIQRQLRQGKKLEVGAWDRAQQNLIASGTLMSVDNQIDTGTGTVKLKALFANEDESLFPNQFVNTRLLVDTLHDVTLLPNPVIQRNAQGAFVYLLLPDQTVAMHPVTTRTTDGTVSAVEGLDPGAVVAADNFNRLTDGMKVAPRSGGTSPSRAEPPKRGAS